MWNYSKKMMEHFLNPRNMGRIENPDASAQVGNIACGDALSLTMKLDRDGKITDVKFETFGCASAIASSSALTEMIKGKNLDEALEVSHEDIADYLGGLPEEKMHCSVMGKDALEAAVAGYRGEKPAAPHSHAERIVCRCFGVSDIKIARVVRENNLHTAEEVTHYCKAGGGCGSCIGEIEEIIAEVWNKEKQKEETGKTTVRPMSNIQKMQRIMETMDQEIRPSLQTHGGDLELIDIIGNRVMIAFRGACSGCVSSGVTLNVFVQERLREFVSDDIIVEEVQE